LTLFPYTTLFRSATPVLLRMARSESRSPDVRASAVHYLGEIAGERVSASLDSVAYEPGDREVRNAAIMAIARRPKAEAVPALIKLAESLPDRELRQTAVRALAQTREPEALAWIERHLARQ
jgi:HEAT repeat protein